MIRKKRRNVRQIIDLMGPDGNAYVLLGYAFDAAQSLGLDSDKIQEEMKAADYENLVQAFDKYFGDIFILER